MFAWLGPIIGIVLVDLILSGDNAVVIGAAASGLPRQQRFLAITLGGGCAVVLRILFSLAATYLLQLTYLGIIGGFLLVLIALRLLWDREKELRHAHQMLHEHERVLKQQSMKKSFLASIATIMVADVTMSLDNVLAIGGLAGGNLINLVIGLVFSIGFLLIGSALVAELISRLPVLLDVACVVVAWTAANIFIGDDLITHVVEQNRMLEYGIYILAIAIVVFFDLLLRASRKRYLQRKA